VPVVELREREIKPKNKITQPTAKAYSFSETVDRSRPSQLTPAAAATLTSSLLLPAKPSPHSVTPAAGAGQWTSAQKSSDLRSGLLFFFFFFSSLILFLSTSLLVSSLVTFSLSIH
jgi:hypothetical protein